MYCSITSELPSAASTCPVCGHGSLSVLVITGDLHYDLCPQCALCTKHVRHGGAREDFATGQASYYDDVDADPFAEPQAIMRERAARRVAVLRAYLRTGASVLEIGPGGGQVANWLRQQDCRYLGCEVSRSLAERLEAQGIPVVHGEFESIHLPESYDLVLSFHTIEHVPEPRAQLTKAFSVTRAGGHFIIATPNARSWEHRLLPRLSANFDAGHLHVLSPKSLRILAEEAGWRVESCMTSEYTSDWLRVVTKFLRRIKGEDEVTSAGKYSRSAASGSIARAISIISVFTRPLRGLQARLGGGNEVVMVLRKPGVA